jgi:hypothetical protein
MNNRTMAGKWAKLLSAEHNMLQKLFRSGYENENS